ncbi:MAG: two-component system response regulator [Rhodospirillales bacterium CG15_BIG_FIL_POST_REV_8_21_14_020_66_15]|nr:MAG: two-component system response regulator [Rhodospirillales bacterium CG15_BIG_FIL_POST_REV_8_21_14_020_66_15]
MAEYDLSQIKVLVAEDYAPMRKLLGQILFELNVADFQMVTSGKEAIDFLEEYHADLILVDNIMEPIDGTELTRLVRAGKTPADRNIPIIMVSGETSKDLIINARDAGVNEFLAKPISTRMVYQRFLNIIENPRSFVQTDEFYGPDRRRRQMRFPGLDRRRQGYAYPGPAASAAGAST